MPMSLQDYIQKPTVRLETQTYVNFDNAASTPALRNVVETLERFLPWYSSVHRGSGLLSRVSTQAYEDARTIIERFVGANSSDHIVIFGKNATEAINKLSYRLQLGKKDIVLVSGLEHHSNDLPWRAVATVKYIKTTQSGAIDTTDFLSLLKKFGSRIKLVAITGTSNVTGFMPDIEWFATKTHHVGAYLFVDCAQLAAHHPINMKSLEDPGHIDFIALSGHKMYAPFGSGALIGRQDIFQHGKPEYSGGGTVSVVTHSQVDWASIPDRDEAGTPNIIGAIAMATAARSLEHIGFDKISAHENNLTAYALQGLKKIPGLIMYGEDSSKQRGSIITFNLKNIPHQLVAAILGHEWNIGVRNGCFCAHPYVTHLLGLKKSDINRFRYQALHGRRDAAPGMVRVSFGFYNTHEEVDRLILALTEISSGRYGTYNLDIHTGIYTHASNSKEDFTPYFRL